MAWLRLFRIALAPTIVWDVSAGAIIAYFALAEQSGAFAPAAFPWSAWTVTVLAVLLVFHAGMALNDWSDRAEDKRVGRARPLVRGEISPTVALVTALGMLAGAIVIAMTALPNSLSVMVALVVCVLVYDLLRGDYRAGVGPMVLSLCRGASLTLGMLTIVDFAAIFDAPQTLWAVVSYLAYVLFLGRLASNEEEGGPAKRMVVFATGSALAPLFLINHADPQWLTVAAWIAFAAWLIFPAIRDAQQLHWSPQRIQLAVRRALVGLPCVPAIAVIASHAPAYWAAGGLVALLGVRGMVRVFPPE